MAVHTSYVSLNSTDKTSHAEMDTKSKRGMASFSLTDDIRYVFDEKARVKVEEYSRGQASVIGKSPEIKFTRKESKAAMKKLKTEYWKSTGLDGIMSWMLDKAG